MEEEKSAAVAASKPEISSEEAVDEIEGDNNEAKETGSSKSPISAQIEESEQLMKMEGKKAAASADDNKATETGSLTSAQMVKWESWEEDVDEIEVDNRWTPRLNRPWIPRLGIPTSATTSGVAGGKPKRLGQIRARIKLRERLIPLARRTLTNTIASGAAEEDKPLKYADASGTAEEDKAAADPYSSSEEDDGSLYFEADDRIEGDNKEAIEKPESSTTVSSVRTTMALFTLLNAMLMLTTLWYGRSMPQHFLEFVWVLSVSTSFSIFLWITFLKVMDVWFVFSFLLPVFLLAVVAHYTLSPGIGMFTVHLSTHFAAGFLGYSLAQRRLLLQAKAIKATDEQLRVLPLTHALPNLGVALRLVWVLIHSADYTPVDLMMHFLLTLIGGLLLWITFIASALGDAFMGDDGLTLFIFYFFFMMLNYIFMVVTLGDIVATLVTWFAVLGLSGFLGYSIRICNSPRVTKD